MSRKSSVTKKRVVILGGGLSGLTAAYHLSDTEEMRACYDVTVYQMGWRLGGKCASGINVQANHRIEEHGVHVFSGFYANAFTMLRECYASLDRPPATPLSSCLGGANPAFEPHNRLSLMETVNDRWNRWDLIFDPDASQLPGDSPRSPKLWRDLKKLCASLHQEYERLTAEQKAEFRAQAVKGGGLRRQTQQALKMVRGRREDDPGQLFDSLSDVSRLVRPRRERGTARQHIAFCRLVKQLIGAVHVALRAPDSLSDDVRHFLILANLGLAIVRGILKHRVLRLGFDCIDDYDFRDWLKKHGASPAVRDSPILHSLYASVFAYQPDGKNKARPRLSAAVALRVLWRTFFDFRGGFVWKMQAGMGETVIAPLYEILKQRQVKFKFFHRVERLELTADKSSIARIHITRQVDLKVPEYQPLLLPAEHAQVDIPSWPSEPRYEQIDDSQARRLRELKKKHVDLESAWLKWEHDSPAAPLEADHDFDTIVLAIPVGGLQTVCSDLIKQNRKWQQMIKHVKTIQTQSVQLWLNRSALQLGWSKISEEPLLVAYQKPLDAWVGMSQLIEREKWSPEDDVRHIGYFVTTAIDEQPLAEQLQDRDTPRRQHALIAHRAQGMLKEDILPLWPRAADPAAPLKFNWNLLVDPKNRVGTERLQAQYVRANINPSDRYVLSLPGATKYRLRCDESGYQNLILAGDWTRNGLNAGCAEAAVISGMQSARAISQRRLPIVGETDPTLPICGIFGGWCGRRGSNRRGKLGS